MSIEWHDKKDVLLKALFDAEKRKKTSDPPGVSCSKVEEAMADLDASRKQVHDLTRQLEKAGLLRRNLARFQITPRGKRYIRENWDRGMKEVWEEHKKSTLEKLGEG